MKIFTFLLLFSTLQLAQGQNQYIDTTFGTHNGYAINSTGASDFAFKSLLHHNNAIYAIHLETAGAAHLSKYNLNGIIDLDFGINGYVPLNSIINYNLTTLGEGITLSNDNKLLITSSRITSAVETQIPIVMKYNLDGTKDLSYGTSGHVDHQNTTGAVQVIDSYQLAQGEIFLLCYKYPASVADNPELFLLKVNSTGNYDASFGTNGKMVIPSESGFVSGHASISDSSVYINFYNAGISYLKKFDFQTTSYDATFGLNGAMIISNNLLDQSTRTFFIDTSDTIYVSGVYESQTGESDVFVTKYSNQVIDTNFGTNGILTFSVGGSSSDVFQIQQNGNKLFILGETNAVTDYATSFLASISLNGTLNDNFGENGIISNNDFDDLHLLFDYIHISDYIIAGGLCPSGNFNYAPCLVKYFADNSLSMPENFTTKFSYFPNPTSDELYFKSNEELLSVAVYDMVGRRVKFDSVKQNKTSLSDLSRGSYIVKVTTQTKTETLKIILK